MSLNTPENQNTLMTLKTSLYKVKEAVGYNEVHPGETYKTTRNKQTTYVVVDEVKRDTIVLKRDRDAKDAQTISRAKFDKFYIKAD